MASSAAGTELGAPVPSAGPPADAEPRTLRIIGLAVLGAALIFFVVVNAAQLTAPFGSSHDGSNGGVWAAGSRALREDGPLESRLGGRHLDGTSYANHPPLILLEAALSESLFGEREWASRLPAFLSTLAATLLLYLLLRDAGLRTLTSAAGAGAALLTPMVLAYGSMLDTPMTSLAFGVGILVVWQRQRQGRPPPVWVIVGVAALACLSGWEATLLAWLAAVDLLWHTRRHGEGHDPTRHRWALAAGALVGTALAVGWAAWVYGDLSTLYDQLIRRSSSDTRATRLGALRDQLGWMSQLFAADLLGFVACAIAALVDRKVRALALIALAATVAYPVLLYNGAFYHDYWNYWLVVPIGVGAGWALDRLWSALADRGAGPWVAAAGVLVIGVAVVVPPLRTPSPQAHALSDGAIAGRLAAAARFQPSQAAVADIGETFEAQSWLSYYSRLPDRHFLDPASFLEFAAQHPTAEVLVTNQCVLSGSGRLCRAVADHGLINTDPPRWYLAPARIVAARYRAATAARKP